MVVWRWGKGGSHRSASDLRRAIEDRERLGISTLVLVDLAVAAWQDVRDILGLTLYTPGDR
jgi:hypothetical protein